MRWLDWFFTEKCALCGDRSQSGYCYPCQQLLPWQTIVCRICSRSISNPGICGACQSNPPYYHDSTIPFVYRPPISTHIHRLKYQNQLDYAKSMARMLIQTLRKNQTTLPQLIIPIPLHRRRIIERGFNQAVEIADIVGQEMQIPVEKHALKRAIHTPSQTGLSEQDRSKNVKGVFECATPLTHHSHIALIDDVVTSGNTTNEAAKTLRQSSVKHISVWAVAKT